MQSPAKPPRIAEHAFEVGIGIMLALALIAAVFRTYARVSKFGHFLLDDVFFYIAAVVLIAGTGLLYKDVPDIYLQENVEAGLEAPPADLAQRLIHSEKLQDASTVLLAGALFCIKFSFLCFFRHLIWQNRLLMVWWWFVLAVCIPTAAVVMFSDFISCAYFDDRILGEPSYMLLGLASTNDLQNYDTDFCDSEMCHTVSSGPTKRSVQSLLCHGHHY